MRRLRFLFLLVAGCAPARIITQSEPQTLVVARPAAEVIARAGAHLVEAGFEIGSSDATAGLLTARRARTNAENAPLLSCDWSAGSAIEKAAHTTVVASVSAARGTQDSSRVVVRVRVLAGFPNLPNPVEPSEKWCASNGSLESAIVEAVRQ